MHQRRQYVDAFSGLRFESYQPLHLVSYMVDGTLWPDRAPFYRLHGLALYLAGAVLFFTLLRRLGFSRNAALAGVLFFAVAPYHIESVAWIAGRKDVLMLVFLLVSWHLHLAADASPPHATAKRLVSIVMFVAALLAKSSAMVLPPMMVIVDRWVLKKPLGRSIAKSLFYLPASLAVAVAIPSVWSDASLIQQSAAEMGSRPALVGWTLFHYIETAVWPFHLSPLYAMPDRASVEQGAIACCGLLLATAAVAAFRIRRKKPIAQAVAAGGVFLVALLPFPNAVPLYYLRSDRYLLLPSIGIALGVAAIVERGVGRKTVFFKPAVALIALFIVAMGVASAVESYHWRDSLGLWRHAVSREPNAYYARLKLGETLRDAGRPAESVRQYRAAMSIRPLSPTALGGVFWGSLLEDMNEATRRAQGTRTWQRTWRSRSSPSQTTAQS